MAENEQQILTKEGKRQLEQELHHLINEVRPEVIEELKAARAQGDLSENADYDAARTRQADVEGEIKRIEALLNNCRVIDEDDNTGNEKVVKIGSTVTFHDNKLNKDFTYQILGSVESDPFKGIISNASPLAQAVLEHSVGEEVTVEVKTPYTIKILNITCKPYSCTNHYIRIFSIL